MDEKKFREWLIEKKHFGVKSTNDIISRIKRAGKLIKVTDDVDSEKIINKLENIKEFQHMSLSVKSQLKRAIRLKTDYQKTLLNKS
jgi:hypothetical protein